MRIRGGHLFGSLALTCIILGLPGPAQSQVRSGDQFLTIGVGLGTALTEIDWSELGGGKGRMGGPGLAGGMSYMYHTTPALGIGFDFSGMKFGEVVHRLPAMEATTSGSLFVAEAITRFLILPEEKASPFLMAGLGFGSFSADVYAKPARGYLWSDTSTTEERKVLDSSSVGMAASLGAGFFAVIGEKSFLKIEGRWHYSGVDREKFGTSSVRAVSGIFSTGWKF